MTVILLIQPVSHPQYGPRRPHILPIQAFGWVHSQGVLPPSTLLADAVGPNDQSLDFPTSVPNSCNSALALNPLPVLSLKFRLPPD